MEHRVKLEPAPYLERENLTRCPRCAAVLYIGDVNEHRRWHDSIVFQR